MSVSLLVVVTWFRVVDFGCGGWRFAWVFFACLYACSFLVVLILFGHCMVLLVGWFWVFGWFRVLGFASCLL